MSQFCSACWLQAGYDFSQEGRSHKDIIKVKPSLLNPIFILHLYIILYCINVKCCTEFGYCHSRENWESATYFRDCNGISNGSPLPMSVIQLELEERNQGRLAADNELLGRNYFKNSQLKILNI